MEQVMSKKGKGTGAEKGTGCCGSSPHGKKMPAGDCKDDAPSGGCYSDDGKEPCCGGAPEAPKKKPKGGCGGGCGCK